MGLNVREEFSYLWEEDKEKYILVDLGNEQYSIFGVENNAAVIIESNEKAENVISRMKKSGNRIVKSELLKYVIENRPIPNLIEVNNDCEIYRLPDTGELVSVLRREIIAYEPEYKLVITGISLFDA